MKTTSRTKHGAVRYLHLAHNQWDATAGRSVPKLLYSLGRGDQLDSDAIKRPVASLARLLDPADAASAAATADLTFLEARPYGGTYVLEHIWQRLRIDHTLTRLALPKGRRGRSRDLATAERVLFGLVANRALEPSSKLAAADWISNDVHIDHLPEGDDDACYRAMDHLHEVTPTLQRHVFDQVATLLNLEVDLLFFDTTSTYFQLDSADAPIARDDHGRSAPDGGVQLTAGFRTRGRSKDYRDDVPQIVIDLGQLARSLVNWLTSPTGSAVFAATMSDAAHLPEIAQAKRRFYEDRFGRAGAVVSRAVARGELPASVDPAELIKTLVAPIYLRLLVTAEPIDQTTADHAAQVALVAARAGVLSPSPGQPPAGTPRDRRSQGSSSRNRARACGWSASTRRRAATTAPHLIFQPDFVILSGGVLSAGRLSGGLALPGVPQRTAMAGSSQSIW